MSDGISKKEKHQRISGFVADVLKMGNHLDILDDSKVVWNDDRDSSIILPISKDKSKTLYSYTLNCTDPNGIILNPMYESVVVSKEASWFYKTIPAIFRKQFIRAFEKVIDTCLIARTDPSVLAESPLLAHMLGPLVKDVDETIKKEFNIITSSSYTESIIWFLYKKSEKTTYLYTFLQEKDKKFINSFNKKIRKKFWTFFEDFIKYTFAKEDVDSEDAIISCTASSDSKAPHFTTFITVWLEAWKRIMSYMELLMSDDQYQDHIDMFGRCEKNLKDVEFLIPECSWLSSGTVDIEASKNVVKSDTGRLAPPPPVQTNGSFYPSQPQESFYQKPMFQPNSQMVNNSFYPPPGVTLNTQAYQPSLSQPPVNQQPYPQQYAQMPAYTPPQYAQPTYAQQPYVPQQPQYQQQPQFYGGFTNQQYQPNVPPVQTTGSFYPRW